MLYPMKTGVLGTAAAMIWANAALAAPERVMLPYECTKTGARVTLTPSAPRIFAVLGPHEVRRIAACRLGGRAAGHSGCQLIDVHRFDVSCGTKRTGWAEIAGAIVRRWPHAYTHGRAGMTTGFAALGGTGAQLIAPDAPPAAPHWGLLNALVTSQPLPDLTPVTVAAIPPAQLDTTMSLLTERAHRDTLAVATAGVDTSISRNDLPAPTPPPAREGAKTIAAPSAPPVEPHALALAGLMLIVTLTAGSAGAALSRLPALAREVKRLTARSALVAIGMSERAWRQIGGGVSAMLALRFGGAAGMRARPAPLLLELKAANAASAVAAMLVETEARLSILKGAGPLREVLAQECMQLRQRLCGLEASASENDEAAARASPGFRNLLRDIERVRRIADSAALSLGAARGRPRVPATRAEAFDLLGLNPEAPEGTLKKVADGLRMSWHPDHARDASDRAEREARVKAINVAIELIKGGAVVA